MVSSVNSRLRRFLGMMMVIALQDDAPVGGDLRASVEPPLGRRREQRPGSAGARQRRFRSPGEPISAVSPDQVTVGNTEHKFEGVQGEDQRAATSCLKTERVGRHST